MKFYSVLIILFIFVSHSLSARLQLGSKQDENKYRQADIPSVIAVAIDIPAYGLRYLRS